MLFQISTQPMGVIQNPLTENFFVYNFNDGFITPPNSYFMITEDGNFMITESLNLMVTE